MAGIVKSVGLTVGLLLCLCASAQATPYYATPSPAGGATCAEGSPCALSMAAGLATVAGDQVFLDPGSYTLTASLTVNNDVTLGPKTVGTRPTITNAAGFTVFVQGGAIQDVKVEASGLGAGVGALRLNDGGRAERVQAAGSGNSSSALLMCDGAVITDSTLYDPSMFATAFIPCNFGPSAANVVRNVSAYGGREATFVGDTYAAAGVPLLLAVENSILIGGTAVNALRAFGTDAGDVAVSIDHSNYNSFDDDPPRAVITDIGGHQTTPAMLSNPTGGLFIELAGSPTINAGAAVPGLSATAFDGQPRCLGTAPDIGADEFAETPCSVPPAPAATPTPRKKCKKGFRLKKVKTKSGKKKKKCVRKKKRRKR